jgi:parallel beta-helix repeat protein
MSLDNLSVDGNVRVVVSGGNTTATGNVALEDDPPTIESPTAIDHTDGDGVVRDGDTIEVSATVFDAETEVESVTANASAFGAGTLSLADEDGDGTYTGTFTVNASASAGEGGHAIRITATDTTDHIRRATTNTLELTATASISSCTVIDESGYYELANDITDANAGTCLNVTAGNVVIDGLGRAIEAENGSGTGIRVGYQEGAQNVTITDLTVRGWETGIDLRGVTEGNVSDVRAVDTGVGIDIVAAELPQGPAGGPPYRIAPSADVTLRENSVTGANATGISVDRSRNLTIRDNTVRNVNASGIAVVASEATTVADNTVSGNNGTGVAVAGRPLTVTELKSPTPRGLLPVPRNNTLVNNTARANNGSGVVLLDTDGNELRDNHLIANNGSGVSVRPSSAGNEVRNNTAERNDRFGVLLADSVDTALVDNTATGNAESGFFLSGDARTITDNAATENGQDGFLILSAGETLDGNAATDNARHGFRVQFRAENVTLHGGTATGNEADGVSIRAAGSTVTGIDATGNDRDGIQVRFVDDTGIEGAVANDNGRHGVLLNGSVADTRLSDTTANGNDRTGFALSGSAGRAPANTSLSDNVARNNEVWAIAIRNASGTVVDELDVGASTEPGTTLSFGGENVAVGPAASPPASPDNESLGRYVEAESVGGGAFLDLELHYTDADASGIDESSLTIRRYDGSEWVAVDSTPDPAANVVAANVTDFSTFGGFGTAGGENESDDGEDGEEGDDGSTIVPGQPGFGVIVVGVALLLAGLLARRRA